MKVYFIGAGPGDPLLMTIRGIEVLKRAGYVIYAGSLINKEILKWARKEAKLFDSASMTLKEIVQVVKEAQEKGEDVARLHSGDPGLYSALAEQTKLLDEMGIGYEVIPGVTSYNAASASLKKELTQPGVTQSVIITRLEGKSSPVPEAESLESLASHQATMVILLSAERIEEVQKRLLSHYPPETPSAVVYKASWPGEEVTIQAPLKELAQRAKEAGISKTAVIMVSKSLEEASSASKLYDATFSHQYRKGKRP